jgi:predicted dehydrogenase
MLAGTGSIGRRHAANLQTLRPNVAFGLLRDGGRQDGYSESLGARVFDRIDDAIDWRPDLAVVATPSDRHHEVIAPLLRAGVGSFIEKPVVISAADVNVLECLCDAVPPTQVGCVLRFLPSLRQVNTWLQSGVIGNLTRASLEVGQWLPDWRPRQDYRRSYSASQARGGGVVFDLVHEIDLACWLFRADELLGAWGGQQSSLDIDAEDVALLALRGSQGALLSVQLDYVSRTPLRRLTAVGDAGSIHWDLPARRCVLQRHGEPEQSVGGFDTTSAYVDAMRELVDAVELGTATSLPLVDGLRATRIAIDANSLIRKVSA